MSGYIGDYDGHVNGRRYPHLSDHDERALLQLDSKLQMVRDRTIAVATGHSTGFYLYGAGGIGKSYCVLSELKRIQANFKLFNSRMTGRGLFNALDRYPDATFVLEDMEQIMRDKAAQGVLRSALWGQRRDGDRGPMERLVTWSAHSAYQKEEYKVVFTGGIIMLGNCPLRDLPQLDAIRTRIVYMHMHASDSEMRALMRHVSSRAFEHNGLELEPRLCTEVCEHLIEQAAGLHHTLDMRILVNAFHDYLQWQECESACHWKDLVDARVRERASHFRGPVSFEGRSARTRSEEEIARSIAEETDEPKERVRLWIERTGKSQATFYRRMSERTEIEKSEN